MLHFVQYNEIHENKSEMRCIQLPLEVNIESSTVKERTDFYTLHYLVIKVLSFQVKAVLAKCQVTLHFREILFLKPASKSATMHSFLVTEYFPNAINTTLNLSVLVEV